VQDRPVRDDPNMRCAGMSSEPSVILDPVEVLQIG